MLPASFTVINDVEFKRFNVDHVVVGPSGIWAIETKSRQGTVEERSDGVWVDGRRLVRDPRRQARGGAAAISQYVHRMTGRRYWVEAIVCFPKATVRMNGHPLEAQVLGWHNLLTHLRHGPRRLSDAERRQISQVLMIPRS